MTAIARRMKTDGTTPAANLMALIAGSPAAPHGQRSRRPDHVRGGGATDSLPQLPVKENTE